MKRRTYIKSTALGAAGYLGKATTNSVDPKKCDCECAGKLDPPDGLHTADDIKHYSFTVTGVDKDGEPLSCLVRWMSNDWFVKITGDDYVGVTFEGNTNIYLNKKYADSIDSHVIAHEFGHVAGYDHETGTLMSSFMNGMSDSARTEPLADTTVEIFEKMDDVEIYKWDIGRLGDLSSLFADGTISIKTLGFGASRYASGSKQSAMYTSDWDEFGGQPRVRSRNIHVNEFYSQNPNTF